MTTQTTQATESHVVVVNISLQGYIQKKGKSKDLGQIWDSAEEAKKAEWEKNPIIFILILKPHRWPNP